MEGEEESDPAKLLAIMMPVIDAFVKDFPTAYKKYDCIYPCDYLSHDVASKLNM